ncbi:hypothetical protein DXG03_000901 [Asterophora parasitica]|uniref:Threonine/serine exporter-like N-terminal domain-containing protein n=1 Tax=Asterophora parasitica TaxID=117018 RepID=A0A9P7KBV7_9AGAR|nr:hypothetical protein DXG03_000901 [Asterophora parasitica]
MSSSAQPSNEEKRPGNMYFTPGTKTPRKVQWLDTDANASTNSLDERGLNPAAFQRLTQALERHRTSSATKVYHYPPQPEPAHSIDISDMGGGGTRGGSSPHSTYTLVSQAPLCGLPTGADSGSSSKSMSPQNYVPGNFIDSSERAGLPGASEPHGSARQQAERVVQSHTRRGISRYTRAKHTRMKKKKYTKECVGPPESRDISDAERDSEAATPHFGSGGVLSALLSLYGQEPDLSSGASTAVTSPPRPWVHPQENSRHHKRDEPRHVPSNLASEVIPTPPTLSRRSSFEERKEPRFSRLTPANLVLRRHKTSKTQSGAGVFGPLIASTGNLTGFAAPIQSQLQPDLKRPGYRLSRYTHEEKPRSPRTWFQDGTTMSLLPSGASTPIVQSAPPSPTHTEPTLIRQKWPGMLKDFPGAQSIRSLGGRGRSGTSTPARSASPAPYREAYFDFKRPAEEDKENTWKRKKARVFITRHVAKIIERQEFIMKFARAMMMFGGPSHRLQAQVNSTGHVLDIELSCIYLPDVLLISFDDNSTSTSNVKFIRQGSSLDLQKLSEAYTLYWKVSARGMLRMSAILLTVRRPAGHSR